MVRLKHNFEWKGMAVITMLVSQGVLMGLTLGVSPIVNAAETNTNTRTCTQNSIPVDCETGLPIEYIENQVVIPLPVACPLRGIWIPNRTPIYESIYGKLCNYRVENPEFIAVKLQHSYDGAGFDVGTGLSAAYSMNDNTEIVGQAMTSNGDLHAAWMNIGAVYFHNHYISDLGVEGKTSSAHGINNVSTYVGQVELDGGSESFGEAIWHSQVGMNYPLEILGGNDGVALDITRAFHNWPIEIATGHGTWSESKGGDGKNHGFLWTYEGPGARYRNSTIIGGPDEENWALAVSDDQTVVGYHKEGENDQAYMWKKSMGIYSLTDYDGPSRALNVNNNKSPVIVGYATEGEVQHAVHWINDELTQLPSVGGAQVSAATAATDGQDYVGYSGDSAVLWRDGVVYNLNDRVVSGLSTNLTRAIAMNRHGRILVEGEDGFYILIPTEEPNVNVSSLVEVGRTGDFVKHNWITLNFDRNYQSPIFVASIETFDGGDTAGLRAANLNNGSIDLLIEEEQSNDQEIAHVTESIGYFVFEEGDIRDSNGSVIGEAGKVSSDQVDGSVWHSVSLNNEYVEPVVIMQPLMYADDSPAHVRIRNVGSDGFEYQIEEWDYLDQSHAAEDMYFVVIEKGNHDILDLNIEADVVDANEGWSTVSYLDAFSEVPVVLSQVQTYNEAEAVVTRQRNVSSSGFEVRCQEEEANDNLHATESVGYIVIGK